MYPFHPCSTIGIFGCTSSGKTSLVFRLLKERASIFLSDPPEKILYCYNISQPLFLEMEKELENIEFCHGLPTEDKLNSIAKSRLHNIIILDDLSHQIANDEDIECLFTQKAHHLKFTVILLSQNLFSKGRKHQNNRC